MFFLWICIGIGVEIVSVYVFSCVEFVINILYVLWRFGDIVLWSLEFIVCMWIYVIFKCFFKFYGFCWLIYGGVLYWWSWIDKLLVLV